MSEPKRTNLSPWAVLYGQLLRAESIAHGRTPAQHAASTRLRAEEAVRALNAAHAANQERRERVLRHPDLAAQLRDVLDIADAARWNGWVPPAEVPGPARGPFYVMNTSPVRAALVRICREAYLRENPEAQAERAEGERDAS